MSKSNKLSKNNSKEPSLIFLIFNPIENVKWLTAFEYPTTKEWWNELWHIYAMQNPEVFYKHVVLVQ